MKRKVRLGREREQCSEQCSSTFARFFRHSVHALGVTTPRPLRLLEAVVLEREAAGGALGVPAEEEVSAVWVVAAVAGVPAEGFEAEAVDAPVFCVVEAGVAPESCWLDEGVSSGGGESCSI